MADLKAWSHGVRKANWLYYVHKNFLLHNMEISYQKIMLDTKKSDPNCIKTEVIITIDGDIVCIINYFKYCIKIACLDQNFSLL